MASDFLRIAHRSQPCQASVRVGVSNQKSASSCTDTHVRNCFVGRDRVWRGGTVKGHGWPLPERHMDVLERSRNGTPCRGLAPKREVGVQNAERANTRPE